MATPTSSSRIAYLDGIRTVAIVAVIGSHWGGSYLGIFQGGYIGVDLFFVLSGYIISKIVWRKRDTLTYGAFLVGRVRRLYPALIGVVVVTIGLIALVGSVPLGQAAQGGLFALVQVNSVVEGLHLASSDPFGVTWSLSAEWVFYLIWPLAIIFGRKLSARQLGLMAAIAAAVLFAASLPTSPEWFYYGPESRGAQLLAGSATALLTVGWKPGPRSRRTFSLAAPAAVVFVAAWTVLGPDHFSPLYRVIGFPLATVAAVVLVLVGVVHASGAVSRALALPWMAAIGRASYSLYLWHVIPVMVLDKDMIPLPNIVLGVIGVISTVVLTYLSYRFLEKPFLRARSRDIAAPDKTTTNRVAV
ncbi:MAG: acyltransferase [Mycetocola sp.]